MFKSPPKTITTPLNQRTLLPNSFSKNSGMVITFLSLKGFIQKPVRPTMNMAIAIEIPGVTPANPYLKPNSALAMQVAIPNSLADKEAMPKYRLTLLSATRKSSTLRIYFFSHRPAMTVPTRYTKTILPSISQLKFAIIPNRIIDLLRREDNH